MANIVWTAPDGWVEETGAHVSFKAPCDCINAGNLVIGNNTYAIVDAMNDTATGKGTAFVSGAIVEVILDCQTNKAYIQNSAHKQDTPKLLWKNNSPASSFAAQTLTLGDLSAYRFLKVFFCWNTGDQNMASIDIDLSASTLKGLMSMGWWSSYKVAVVARAISNIDVSTGAITFERGEYPTTSTTSSTIANNGTCIPLAIYGY